MKRILIAALLGLACTTGHAAGQSALSNASANLSGVVVGGSILTLAAGGSVVIASVRTVGDALEIVLENVADASSATVRLSGRVAGGVSLAAGAALEVVTASTGYVLVMSGKAIAFLPNEAGKALLHHARAV
ncbi:hypothetical protein [Massilia yuzhufengensis]|uniref:Uncharacterized protein n=1 Tax=Massilia yuzhufengensis TaxID=1164594 RepID=A0A1I1UPJ1_9BURK|nr:hypothetical protein [Massilia yuzhufengensis]SFD70703.1 hypothetical protein SAMN05216204_1348 [Massilia yuzhufengensis]